MSILYLGTCLAVYKHNILHLKKKKNSQLPLTLIITMPFLCSLLQQKLSSCLYFLYFFLSFFLNLLQSGFCPYHSTIKNWYWQKSQWFQCCYFSCYLTFAKADQPPLSWYTLFTWFPECGTLDSLAISGCSVFLVLTLFPTSYCWIPKDSGLDILFYLYSLSVIF